jgi:hypothetical protein
MRLKSRWGCQNHPEANTATSFEGRLGVVGISGQMLLPLAKAYREAIVPDLAHGIGENAKQVDAKEKMMAAMERPMGTRVIVDITVSGVVLLEVGWYLRFLSCKLRRGTYKSVVVGRL